MTRVIILEFDHVKLCTFESPLDIDGSMIGEEWTKGIKQGIDNFAKTCAGFIVDERYLIRFEVRP
jgi:hypothetical protein